MSVDLPEPDGPMTAGELPPRDVERDAAERVDGGLALAVAPRDLVRRYDIAPAGQPSPLVRLEPNFIQTFITAPFPLFHVALGSIIGESPD